MRRRRKEQTITLFSFQDIITGVAGVMLFILLLLVVQLTLKTATATATAQINDDSTEPIDTTSVPATESSENTYPELKQSLEEMKRELEKLQRGNKRLLEAANQDLDAKIKAAQDAVDDLIAEAEEAKRRAEDLENKIAAESVSDERKAILRRRDALRKQLEKLGEERQRAASGKLVTFSPSANNNMPMWVVDLHDTRASIFDVAVPESVITVRFDRKDPPSQIITAVSAQLKSATQVRNIILVLRPSVSGQGLELLAAMRSQGYRIALELLDEDTMISRSNGAAAEESP